MPRTPSPAFSERRPPAGASAAGEPLLVIESDAGRQALLERAQRSLHEDECLVKVVDVLGLRRSVRTVPTDPRARLVAQERPILLRGGLTSLVSYYVVPTDALGARETHYVNGEESHHYDVLMNVARVGSRPPRAVPA